MKAISVLGFATLATANYGTTGHYGNKYGHSGSSDHQHNDHIYGYDSIAPKRSLKTAGSVGYIRNTAILTALTTEITNANNDRIASLQRVKARRDQRLLEIDSQNRKEIGSPFDYQIELLDKQKDDVVMALTWAIQDSTDAYDDMLDRLQKLRNDKVTALDAEVLEILEAIERTEVDQKSACAVLFALRAEILKNVSCEETTFTATYDATDVQEFR